jgi:hypothetical protein
MGVLRGELSAFPRPIPERSFKAAARVERTEDDSIGGRGRISGCVWIGDELTAIGLLGIKGRQFPLQTMVARRALPTEFDGIECRRLVLGPRVTKRVPFERGAEIRIEPAAIGPIELTAIVEIGERRLWRHRARFAGQARERVCNR